MFEKLDVWIAMGQFKPNSYDRATARSFVFHHIRPSWDQHVMLLKDQALKLPKHEVSLIGGISGDFFVCYKRGAVMAQPGELVKHYSANEIARSPEGYFTQWRLAISNFFGGPWEVFNGPNRIAIGSTRV